MSASLLMPFAQAGHAADQAAANTAGDGVQVGNASTVRKLVPAEALEKQATLQYSQLKQQAAAKRALAANDDPQLRRLRAIAARILPQTARWNPRATSWQWEVSLIHSKQVNAFCMPGGKIVFFTALLDQLKLNDDEVAQVMGHEIAHALREHARERVAKGELTNLGANLLSQVLGLGSLGNLALGAGAQLMTLKFSRSDETEADLVGMDLAARAGYDPRAGISLWNKMSAAGNGAPPEWMSTHPSGRSRIHDIERNLNAALPLYAKARGITAGRLPAYQP